VATLLGDPSKAKNKLGWAPTITAQELCQEMTMSDLNEARQKALLKASGYAVNLGLEK